MDYSWVDLVGNVRVLLMVIAYLEIGVYELGGDDKAKPIHEALLERKIITGTSSDANVLRLLPPLCLKKAEVDLFVDELKAVLKG